MFKKKSTIINRGRLTRHSHSWVSLTPSSDFWRVDLNQQFVCFSLMIHIGADAYSSSPRVSLKNFFLLLRGEVYVKDWDFDRFCEAARTLEVSTLLDRIESMKDLRSGLPGKTKSKLLCVFSWGLVGRE